MKNFYTKIVVTLIAIVVILSAASADAYTTNTSLYYYGQSYPYTTDYNYTYVQPGYVNPYQSSDYYNVPSYGYNYQQYPYQYQTPYYGYGYTNPYNYSQYTYTNVGTGSSNNGDRPDVETFRADDIEDNSAELNGEVDMNNFRNGIVFFVYGQDEDMIEDVEDDYDTYDDVKDDEEDDDFEVIRVDRDLDDEDEYSEEVDDLDEDEEYFYIICVEYEDDDNDERLECGNVEDFETDRDNHNGDEPEATTLTERNIDYDSAEIRGEIEMNDFRNGYVFFVYGEDQNDILDVEHEDTYSDIDERGDDIQKFAIDSDLDGDASYTRTITQLDSNTNHYFRICVEFENEDDDQELECGEVEHFRTD